MTNERPGVYTSYEVTDTRYKSTNGGVVGVAAMAGAGDYDEVYSVTSTAQAAQCFGREADITKLADVLFKNGVYEVKAAPVTANTAAAYTAAFNALIADKSVKVITCGSTNAGVHAALKSAIMSADTQNLHKIAVIEAGGGVDDCVAAAKAVNCERIIMVSPSALSESGEKAADGTLAAAVCGAIVSESDPSVPVNGAALYGIGGITAQYGDGDIAKLVTGGVSPVEKSGADVLIVRAVTTRTQTNGAPDKTWRDLTTVRIIDDVIPTVRDALKRSFARVKNTAQTRGAIRTRVIVELERKVAAEIIESYGGVTVSADENDPAVCNVSFDFTVTHGINRIDLKAYITV